MTRISSVVMDAYLLALVRKHRGVMATFDRGLEGLAAREHGAAIEFVPVGHPG